MDNLRKLSVAVRQESKMLEIIRKRIDNTAEDKIISPSNSVVHLHLAHHVQFQFSDLRKEYSSPRGFMKKGTKLCQKDNCGGLPQPAAKHPPNHSLTTPSGMREKIRRAKAENLWVMIKTV